MIYISENNWWSWRYGSGPYFGRQSGNDQFRTFYKKTDRKIYNFKIELENAAKSTLDHYPGLRPCIFFSGGVDSELILRSYINIGSNPKVYIVRYENDYNIYDVSYAITICSMLNINYSIINFNLQKFYENDAMSIVEDAQIDRAKILPHLKFTDCADGLIIVGLGDVYWSRMSDNYSEPGVWLAPDFEFDIGCDKYNILHNRSAIFQWWKWSPGLLISYTQLDWFKNLVSDKFYGKMGINSTKIKGFREYYPDLIVRKKQTGFEKIDRLIQEFEESILKKYKIFPWRNTVERTLDQFYLEIVGISYCEYH